VILRGSAAGGLVGLGTFLGPVILLAIQDLLSGPSNPAGIALIAAIGSAIAIAVGVAFGLVFTLLDLARSKVAGFAVPNGGDPDPATNEAAAESTASTADSAPDSDPVGDRN